MVKLYTLLSLTMLALTFQNCANTDFSTASLDNSAVDTGGPLPDDVLQVGDDLKCEDKTTNDDEDDNDDKDDNDDDAYHASHYRLPPLPTHHDDDDDNDGEGCHKDTTCVCPELSKAAKILININHYELLPANLNVATPLDTVLDLLNLETAGFQFGPLTANAATSTVRAVLNGFGNKIITVDMTELALKGTAVNFVLPAELPLEIGRSYVIKAAFGAGSQIVKEGNKCLLKPVLNVTAVEEAPLL